MKKLIREEIIEKYANGERDFKELCLKNIDLSNLYIRFVNFSRSDLSGTELSGSDLSGSDLFEANLKKANLSGANLSEANLSYANLNEADLKGADLSYANLILADLRESNLSGAKLDGADLSGAKRELNMIEEKKCSNCLYFHPVLLIDDIVCGQCRKNAPIQINKPEFTICKKPSGFPETKENEWCGDYKINTSENK